VALNAGARLGPYEIVSPIGAGGMGEVYRARDTRLDRTVAVKVLPPHLSDSPEARQRFEREARAISRLSHPHICALYDVGHEGEVEYLVMEYLEGETLATRLAKGPLPLDQTLRFAGEIARALDTAHREGIVHRDLKPQNVMLTRSGVKLLDFGLAKSVAPASKPIDFTAVATAAEAPVTREGTIVGTFQYMAPEQLEGRDADARTDIFAFGAVVYEMATGQRAFQGTSQISLITAILRDEPKPISQVAPMAPASLDRLVRTCLAKAPDERWQSAHDIAAELAWIGQESGRSEPAAAAARRPRGGRAISWAIAAVLGAVAGALAVRALHPPARPPEVRSSIPAPDGWRFDLLAGPPALSPDGTRLAFAARTEDGRTFLFLRPLESDSAQMLAGSEGAGFPFWSPDGKTIGYSTGNAVWTVSAGGGVPEKLNNMIRARTGSWSRSGVILFSRNGGQALASYSLAERKGKPETTLGADSGHYDPQFLPDGVHYVYLARRLDPTSRRVESDLYAGSVGSAERKLLFRSESSALFVPPGHLLFRQEGDLVARAFDPDRLTISGEPRVIAHGIAWEDESLTPLLSASATGQLAWMSGSVLGLAQLSVTDLEGKRLQAFGEPANVWTPRLSHDGRRIAVEIQDRANANRDIWIYDIDRPALPTRWTFDPGDEATPVWSPDDSRIAFLARRDAPGANPPDYFVVSRSATGEGGETQLLKGQGTRYLTDWSPDGEFLAFNWLQPATRNDVAALSTRDLSIRKIVTGATEDRDGVFSPDGRWLAYMSGESGRFEIYVRPFPGAGGPWQVSTGGGLMPRWRRDGKALFYVTLDGRLMTVPVRAGSGFAVDSPVFLFSPHLRRTLIAQYDVFPDGKRILLNALAASDTADAVHLIQNWDR
jgi:Tol biopolymer transport system component/tRNA A-37 threonylcarbamoyl transferase component Bud32